MAHYDFKNFLSTKFIDDFGKEFKKHEVLWQSYLLMDPNQLKFAKKKAYKSIAYKLNLTVDMVIELLKDFPNVCFDMLKKTFTKKYNVSGSSVSESPKQQLPKWLLYLMMKSDMFEKIKQNDQHKTVTKCHEPEVLIQELLTSVELSLEVSYGKKIQRLKGPCAVKYFAKKYGVRVADVLSVCHLHDVPGTLRLNHQEWKVTDLILLYSHELKLIHLSQSNFSTGRNHSSLILLYKLMVAARTLYSQELQVNKIGNAEKDENNDKDKSENDTEKVLDDLNKSKPSQEVTDVTEKNENVPKINHNKSIDMENEKNESETNNSKDVSTILLKVEGIDENNWYGKPEEQKVVWALVYTGFINRGRSASIIYLQRRWLELLHLARNTILNVWKSKENDMKVHPLLPLLVNRFPEIITDYLPPWRQIVKEKLYVKESDVEDLLIECLQNDKINLDINEDLSDADFIKEFYENELSLINTNGNIYNENIEVTEILEKIDPSKAKVTIKFEDSDDDGEVIINDTENNEYVNKYDDMNLDLIENIDREIKEEYDLMENIDMRITHDEDAAVNERTIENVVIKSEEQIKSQSDDLQEAMEISTEEVKREGSPDDKLIKEAIIILTPIDHFNEWKKHSKDGTISCRKFSTKNVSKIIDLDSKELAKCRRYMKDKPEEINKYDNYRVKYEDFGLESITEEKYNELQEMPYQTRRDRIELTKKLRLSRTYYSKDFWRNEINVDLLKKCRLMYVNIKPLRILKKVQLSDIKNIRNINNILKTARELPVPATCNEHHPFELPITEVNSTGKNFHEQTDKNHEQATTNIVDTSVSELRKLLTEVPQPTINTEETKTTTTPSNTTESSFMDSIIDSIRSENNDNITNPITNKPVLGELNKKIISDMFLIPALNSTDTAVDQNTSTTSQDKTKSDKNPNNTKSIIQCLKETLIDDHKLRESLLALSKKKMLPKPQDVKLLVKELAAKCETLKYKDDSKLRPKLWKIHEYRVARHKKELTRNMLVLTEYLPQFKAFLKKRRKRIRNRKMIKKTDKLKNNNHDNQNSVNNEKIEATCPTRDDDDSDEPNLVIDEGVKDTKDYQKDNNKDIKDNTKTKQKKKYKRKKREEKQNDEEKPLRDAYEEWQRQKTMNLKYFTLPNNTQNTDKPSKDNGLKKKNTTEGSLKNKTTGTNTDNIAKKESVVLISDSDSDVQIVDSDVPKPADKRMSQTIKLNLDSISKDSNKFVYPTINLHTHPLYIVYNTPVPNNNGPPANFSQLVVQVHPAAVTPQTSILDLTNEPPSVPVASVDSVTKDKPREVSAPPNITMSLEEYTVNYDILSAPLIKMEKEKKHLCLLNKYIILTDVNLPCDQPTYRTIGSDKTKCLTEVELTTSGDVLLLGKKGVGDYRVCKCEGSSTKKCDLCNLADVGHGRRLNIIKIRKDTFKRIADNPLKYVRLTAEEVRRTNKVVLELIPDIIFMNLMFYKRLTSAPLLYSRLLSAIPDEESFRQLVSKEVELYWLDTSQPQPQYRPLYYSKTNGTFKTTHPDPELDQVLSWIINK
ncbi:unnamed protein product [Danaus chrysippus]|uniref:(African queen) hypothetical protein n=1 Tax=Danaus chrysippus TaxID=151541 RepID=A0A8J2W864_9NEOP|nr:unnamed protein product [Danaus chrysippus]